jgi:hypothetical protein
MGIRLRALSLWTASPGSDGIGPIETALVPETIA